MERGSGWYFFHIHWINFPQTYESFCKAQICLYVCPSFRGGRGKIQWIMTFKTSSVENLTWLQGLFADIDSKYTSLFTVSGSQGAGVIRINIAYPSTDMAIFGKLYDAKFHSVAGKTMVEIRTNNLGGRTFLYEFEVAAGIAWSFRVYPFPNQV